MLWNYRSLLLPAASWGLLDINPDADRQITRQDSWLEGCCSQVSSGSRSLHSLLGELLIILAVWLAWAADRQLLLRA